MKVNLNMTPGAVIFGSLAVFLVAVFFVVFLPYLEHVDEPSDIWRARNDMEERGMALYRANGCQYCHSQFVRQQDWDYGSRRVAQAGDYYADEPPLWGTERQGPDLSQAGGLRSDGWHYAHFTNPRYTRPDSIMPPFHWMPFEEISDLTEYVQGLGYLMADERHARYETWRGPAYEAYLAEGDANMQWLHAHVPDEWMVMPNKYPADDFTMERGAVIYQHYCIGCHGPVGDGDGPGGRLMRELIERGDLEEAPPFNFSFLNRWVSEDNPDRTPIGGMIYYQVMNGITGTSMPAFKTELESEKIWDVANYLAVNFAGHYGIDGNERDWAVDELGYDEVDIPASYEQLPEGREEIQPIPLSEIIAGIDEGEPRTSTEEAGG